MARENSSDLPATFLVVRHAETPWNAEGRFRGHADVGLSDLGHRQAEILARRLASAYSVARVYSSPLGRCLATARPMARAARAPVVVAPALTDMNFGAWAGRLTDEVAATFPDEFRAWQEGDPSFRPPDGESVLEVAGRVEPFLRGLPARHPGQTVALVTHELVCQILVCLALDIPLRRYRHLRHDNASFSILQFADGSFVLAGMNLGAAP